MPRPKTVESEMRAAFERLKNDEPIILAKGSPVSLPNVAKEAGSLPNSLRSDRYPGLHGEITSYAEINAKPVKRANARKTRESASKRIKRLQKQHQKVLNIVNALTSLNEELKRENEMLREGNVTRLEKPMSSEGDVL